MPMEFQSRHSCMNFQHLPDFSNWGGNCQVYCRDTDNDDQRRFDLLLFRPRCRWKLNLHINSDNKISRLHDK